MQPDAALGLATTLASDTDPLTEVYLRFQVRGVAGVVTAAKLRLMVTNPTGDAPTVYGASSSWSEASVTWNTRPARVGGAIADLGAVNQGMVVEYDVTSLITGNGVYTLALIPTSTDGFAAYSRQGSVPPELVLQVAAAPTCGGASSFRFTAVGDHGSSPNASAVFDLVPANGDFLFSLGDLSYGTLSPERAWCDYVKAHVGATYPVECVAGNHDARSAVGHGVIDNFVADDCLPNRMPGVTGEYGKHYYFDYPAAAPLARFIAISPAITFDNGGYFDYAFGAARYDWTAAAIDQARAAGIPWVIVGTHRNCITMGIKTCELGADIFNLLIEKRVDLILQAHDHNYQRSKQLAHGASCSAIVANAFNPACVTDDGSDGQYAKGGGSVLIINGMGGIEPYDILLDDAEAPYFISHMTRETFGLTRVNVTADRLDIDFVPITAGSYTDHASIVAR